MQLELPTPFMLAHVDGGVGWMTFNNPERHNAMKLEMNEAVAEILAAFDQDDEVRVVVMTGAGDKAFVSGADISEFETKRSTPEDRAHFDAVSTAASRALGTLRKPLIAMIRGFCMGGGLATALQADIRVCSDDSQFAIPAARLGLGYGFGGVDKLTKIVGPAKAAEILLTARRFDAAEARHMGLVNQVVAADDLASTIDTMAAAIAANAPLTVQASKAAVAETFKDPGKRDLARIGELVEACFVSDDYREGRAAFMEKRTPEFRGH